MTRARRDQRWHAQAQRLITAADPDCVERLQARVRDAVTGRAFDGPTVARVQEALMAGPTFDVARVRAYCESLIAEADELDTQREVFADWTRARRLGPENRERGAFVPLNPSTPLDVRVGDCRTANETLVVACFGVRQAVVFSDTCLSVVDMVREINEQVQGIVATVSNDDTFALALDPNSKAFAPRGGWPGNLAREYVAMQAAKRKCPRKDCDSGVLVGDLSQHIAEALAGPTRSFTIIGDTDGHTGVACPECDAFKRARPSRAFANGGNMRAAAQRLLDTLDGRCPWNTDAEAQPSECQHPACAEGEVLRVNIGNHQFALAKPPVRGVVPSGHSRGLPGEASRDRCLDCHGTGHNLQGTLPPLPEETVSKLIKRGQIYGHSYDIVVVDDLVDATQHDQEALRPWYESPIARAVRGTQDDA